MAYRGEGVIGWSEPSYGPFVLQSPSNRGANVKHIIVSGRISLTYSGTAKTYLLRVVNVQLVGIGADDGPLGHNRCKLGIRACWGGQSRTILGM